MFTDAHYCSNGRTIVGRRLNPLFAQMAPVIETNCENLWQQVYQKVSEFSCSLGLTFICVWVRKMFWESVSQ